MIPLCEVKQYSYQHNVEHVKPAQPDTFFLTLFQKCLFKHKKRDYFLEEWNHRVVNFLDENLKRWSKDVAQCEHWQRNTPLSILGAERVCTLRLIQSQLPQIKQTNTLCQRELGLCSFPAKKHGSVTLKTSTKHQPQPTIAIKKSYQKMNKSKS